jgi:riboflavin synthase alpha subunit
MKNIIIGIFFTLLNCCSKVCPIDEDFKKIYQNSIETIKIDYLSEVGSSTPYELEKAVLFLSTITGHSSSRDASHFGMIYQSKKDFEMDIDFWEKWYDANKCVITIEKANLVPPSDEFNVQAFTSWVDFLEN